MTTTKVRATHEDFTQFHGMQCSPISANRCINAFNGTILFMPSNYKEKGVANYRVTNLNLLTYYALVLWSFTGLSTLLRMTDFIETNEDLTNGLTSPEITEDIMTFINQESEGEQLTKKQKFKVIRRYAYNFRLPGVRVKMFHLQSSDTTNNKLHLVEIYEPLSFQQFIPSVLIALATVVIGCFVSFAVLHK